MKDYLDDLLVWAITIGVITPLAMAIFKRKRVFIIIVGILIFWGAFPVAIMSELSINGCCGARSAGHNGVGYLLGTLMAIAGVLIVIFSKKLAKK